MCVHICKRTYNHSMMRKNRRNPLLNQSSSLQPESLSILSYQQLNSNIKTYTKMKPFKQIDAITKLIKVFSEVQYNKEWMVPLSEAYSSKIDGKSKLIGYTHIINGPAQSGKTSVAYWALREDEGETAIVMIDCALFRTEMQFIQKLAREVGEQIGVGGLDKRAVAQENIKFSQLNKVIQQKQRHVLLLIRNAERLVEYRKQILLYNLLQWVNSDIKKWVGLIFTTRVISFAERFEKRVRSRLRAEFVSLVRPTPEKMVELLARRVYWLCERERVYQQGNKERQRFYEKVLKAIKGNKKLCDVIRINQQYAQKDIVFFLNSMKIVFSSYQSTEQVMRFDDNSLCEDIARKMEQSFAYIFPFFPKNLLKTCTIPEYIVMAIIHYMGKHQRTPYRFKTVYEVYLQFKQKLVTSQGTGSSFIYSKNILQRSVLKLQQLKLIELDNKEESVWNCDIRCSINPQQIQRGFNEIPNLSQFLSTILKS